MTNNTHEYEFLPAALEIQETPPSPIGRLIIWLVVFLFVAAIAWAYYGEIDIVATAQGKIVPNGNDKIIQPLEIGVIRSIKVQEGQFVQAGDILIELDSTASIADEKRLTKNIIVAKLEKARLLIFSQTNKNVRQDVPYRLDHKITGNVDPTLISREIHLLQSQIEQFQSQFAILKSEQRRLKSSLAEATNYVEKLSQTLPLITERVTTMMKLNKEKMASRESYLQLEQQRIEQQYDLAAFQARVGQIEAERIAIKEKMNALQSQTQHSALLQLTETDHKISSLEQELVKVQQRNKRQQLTAPISGTIHQLVVNTIGGVVTPAQQLMTIVPDNKLLEVESLLANKDIGFVETGQIAETKIDTFPFTKYGVIASTVLQISSDAINHEQLGLVYKMRTSLAQSKIKVGNKMVKLSPGMSVSVEIKTGKRKIIDYFLSPLQQYVDESITER